MLLFAKMPIIRLYNKVLTTSHQLPIHHPQAILFRASTLYRRSERRNALSRRLVLQKKSLLSDIQSGFRPLHSTLTAMLDATDKMVHKYGLWVN